MAEIAPVTAAGQLGLAALVADPLSALVAFDFDGTLSPIVADPSAARPQPGIVEALARLGPLVGGLALVTGRPAGEAVRLAGLDRPGAPERLVVLGHYGIERWESTTGELTTAAPPPGLDVVRRELPTMLAAAGVPDAAIEDKGLAVAVHVRRCAEPSAAYERLREPLFALAERVGLAAEPGRHVIELRPMGMDKGRALSALREELAADTVMFTGDDLGDLAAFAAVEQWRSSAGTGLLVCSGSAEVTVLADKADLVVAGPPGVLQLVRELTEILLGHG